MLNLVVYIVTTGHLSFDKNFLLCKSMNMNSGVAGFLDTRWGSNNNGGRDRNYELK
jgi:hypothetical protein